MRGCNPMRCATLTLNPALDITLRLDGPLSAGAVHRVIEEHSEPGGKGINVAQLIAARGGRVSAGGLLGQQDLELFQRVLSGQGVEPRFVAIAAATRRNLMVVGGADEYKINRPGPAADALPPHAAEAALENVAPGADVLVVSGSLPPGLPETTYAELLQSPILAGRPVLIDTSGAALRAIPPAPTRFLKPNRAELEELLGHALADDDAILRALRALAGEWGGILLSDGPRGAWFAIGTQVLHAPSPDAPRVDTTAAGDMLLGQFCIDFFPHRVLSREIAARAVAAGAAAIALHGSACPAPGHIDALARTVIHQVRRF